MCINRRDKIGNTQDEKKSFPPYLINSLEELDDQICVQVHVCR